MNKPRQPHAKRQGHPILIPTASVVYQQVLLDRGQSEGHQPDRMQPAMVKPGEVPQMWPPPHLDPFQVGLSHGSSTVLQKSGDENRVKTCFWRGRLTQTLKHLFILHKVKTSDIYIYIDLHIHIYIYTHIITYNSIYIMCIYIYIHYTNLHIYRMHQFRNLHQN